MAARFFQKLLLDCVLMHNVGKDSRKGKAGFTERVFLSAMLSLSNEPGINRKVVGKMSITVKEYLDAYETEQKWIEQNYRYRVMEYAGLLEERTGFLGATENEYYSVRDKNREISDGHYYVRKRLPCEVTEEEFRKIESTIPRRDLEAMKMAAASFTGHERKNSGTAAFLRVMAVLVLIYGVYMMVVAISNVTVTGPLPIPELVLAFCAYLIPGLSLYFSAELFDNLQEIVNLLKEKRDLERMRGSLFHNSRS